VTTITRAGHKAGGRAQEVTLRLLRASRGATETAAEATRASYAASGRRQDACAVLMIGVTA
jgi:hypothetical protein